MADQNNPFANAFNPDRGGLTGFIGGLAGVPTGMQAAGSATGDALSTLSQLKEQGMTNQQAMLKFFQTPQGHDFFVNAGPDGLKSLADGLTQITPPAPLLQNVPQGATLTSTDPQTGVTKQLFNNPKVPETPADVLKFQYFTQISKMPQAEVRRLAALQADPSKSDVASQAVDELVKNYGLDAQTGEKLKANVLKVVPIRNAAGEDTGAVSLVDLSTGQPSVQVLNPGNVPGATVPNAAAGTSPSTGAATGVLPAAKPAASFSDLGSNAAEATPPKGSVTENNPSFGSKDTMALGAGPIAKTLGTATKLSEAISPNFIIDEGAKANDRQTLLNELKSNLQAIGTIGGGLSSNKGLIENYVRTYLPQGFFDGSPYDQVQKLIRLREAAETNIQNEITRYNDRSLPHDVQKQAAETAEGWKRVLSSMPSMEVLTKQESDIKAGRAGAPTLGGAANTLIEEGGKLLTTVKKEANGVANKQGVDLSGSKNIDTMEVPELLKIDPTQLSRADKIKLARRLNAVKAGVK